MPHNVQHLLVENVVGLEIPTICALDVKYIHTVYKTLNQLN